MSGLIVQSCHKRNELCGGCNAAEPQKLSSRKVNKMGLASRRIGRIIGCMFVSCEDSVSISQVSLSVVETR